MDSLQASIKIVNGSLLDPSKYDTISKASRRDTCSVGCIRRLLFGKLFSKLFGELFGKLFAEISLSDFLEFEYGCENFSESRACSIFAELLSLFGLFYLIDFLDLVLSYKVEFPVMLSNIDFSLSVHRYTYLLQ